MAEAANNIDGVDLEEQREILRQIELSNMRIGVDPH